MDILKDVIQPVVEEARAQIPSAAKLDFAPKAPLFPEGGLDSMGLVQFLILVEERVEDLYDRKLTLVSEQAMSRSRSPFRDLGALAAFIEELMTGEDR